MADIKWIKLAVDIFDNRKIRQIESMPDGDSLLVIWLKLLTLAGSINDGGTVYFTKDIPYTDQLLATQFNRPLPTVQLALKVFQGFEMIEIVDDMIHVSNWEKYQNVEGLEKIREQTRLRQQRFRERQQLPNVMDNVTVTLRNDTDIDKEEDKNKNKNKRIFIKPTVQEIAEYCLKRGNSVDAQRFYDYYESKGWLVGKSPMKDWKAAVRTWERNTKEHKESFAEAAAELGAW